MSEILDGVLSETLLNEIAEDLGISPTTLRENPVFRVLKGRVLLTYPLKASSVMPEFQAKVYEQTVNPTQNEYYEILSDTGKGGELYAVHIMTDDAVTAISRRIRLTIDGQTPFTQSSASEAFVDAYHVYNLDGQLTKTIPIGSLNIKYNESLKLEVGTSTTLVAGKYIRGVAWWGKVV